MTDPIRTAAAPVPVGAYPHARRVGDLLFVSGMGPRQPGTDAIPGGPTRDRKGAPLTYDIAAQTRATIENIRAVLEAAGSRLEDVVDVTVFLTDMERDFKMFNSVYGRFFAAIGNTHVVSNNGSANFERTLSLSALPTPIAVELKVIAYLGPR